ncbi:transposase [Bacillus albus]|uniref:transposase n=1 Tax=Bacillus albus TaxID=2026189 RepID=UPI000BF2F947|nr:transposase [Bacillus albus]PFB77583.1 transposase [Bacillus anthracis]
MIKDIYLNFPDDYHYKKYLLNLRWNRYMICPFCSALKSTKIGSTLRFHCNVCNTNYSVTVNTVMHNTKLELRKWLIALHLYLNNEKLSYRSLSKLIQVNKNTAYKMINKLQYLFCKNRLAILKISGLNKDVIEIMSLILLIDIRRKI